MRNVSLHHYITVSIVIAALVVGSKLVLASEIEGHASVIDGDTISIGEQRILLHGIDAPESSQVCNRSYLTAYRCGTEAAFALDSFLAASLPTRCVELDRDRYRRVVGGCFRADVVSVNG